LIYDMNERLVIHRGYHLRQEIDKSLRLLKREEFGGLALVSREKVKSY